MLGMKFAARDGNLFLDNVQELGDEGVVVSGFELQVLPEDDFEELEKAVSRVEDSYDFKFKGLHPPFPTSAGGDFLKWESFAFRLGMDYTVLHASSGRDFPRIADHIKETASKAKGHTFLENVPLFPDRRTEGLGSLVETVLVHDELLMDIPHTLYNWKNRLRVNVPPWEQVKLVGERLKAVHVADDGNGDGAVLKGQGNRLFQKTMEEVMKHDVFLIAEPRDGHLDGGQGHKETCRSIWNNYIDV